jgi:hypothetical protein
MIIYDDVQHDNFIIFTKIDFIKFEDYLMMKLSLGVRYFIISNDQPRNEPTPKKLGYLQCGHESSFLGPQLTSVHNKMEQNKKVTNKSYL